ncbi:hypothetical protein HOLleu_05974 [Holothuria leucospilota]|uniref:Uncharacterized protein n=1 Tax=Holothuria leucospilota TaxID=206669 RepID=A0A9Q1CKL0_HOLLE|nr:hypothetical protein HOLleu_05974 [Holothuria leucospilota]
MAFLERAAVVYDVLAHILCLLVIAGQAVVLNLFLFNLTDKSNASPYIWVVLDIIVLLWWILSFFVPLFVKAPPQGIVRQVVNEVRYAYLCWIIYAVVLSFKINHMFFYVAENLVAKPTLYSSTSLKLTVSLAGVAFLLLAYSHHKEIKEKEYKHVIEKISFSACLDVLDCLSLLSFLFILDSEIVLPYKLDRSIRAFSCICFLLPVFPLLVLRIIQGPSTKKWYSFSFIVQTALYFLLVNIPLFSIRLHLWISHDIDISTFFTKNVIMLFKGAIDIITELIKWYKRSKGIEEEEEETDKHERGHMLEEATPATGNGEAETET